MGKKGRAQEAAPPASPLTAPLASLAAGFDTDRIGQHLSAAADEFKLLPEVRDADRALIDRALEVVREFIVERQLILFGGLAIDLALRLKGGHLYADGVRPDYDFLSPRSVEDAVDLAERLHGMGFPSVAAIRAIHVQTMRVRTDFSYVADIGYCPPEIYARLPTLEWRGMRIMHPDFQRCDMHLAFCFPFNGAPREDVYNRWKKDCDRLDLLGRYWPVATTAGGVAGGKLAASKPAVDTSTPTTVRARVPPGTALHGFAALAAFGVLGEGAGVAAAVTVSDSVVKFTVPEWAPAEARRLVVAGADVDVGRPPAARYYPWLDLRPHVEVYPPAAPGEAELELHRTDRRLLSVVELPGSGQLVVSSHYAAVWCLTEAQRTDDPAVAGHYRALYSALIQRVSSLAANEPIEEFRKGTAWPSVQTLPAMGAGPNIDVAYAVRIAGIAARLGEKPPPALGLPDTAPLLSGLPQNWKGGKPRHPAFDYTHELFMRGGEEMRAME